MWADVRSGLFRYAALVLHQWPTESVR